MAPDHNLYLTTTMTTIKLRAKSLGFMIMTPRTESRKSTRISKQTDLSEVDRVVRADVKHRELRDRGLFEELSVETPVYPN